MYTDMARFAIDLYTDIAVLAVPFAFTFGICNVIVNTFLSVAFGGRLKIGGSNK